MNRKKKKISDKYQAEAATGGALYKSRSWQLNKIHRKTPLPEFLF